MTMIHDSTVRNINLACGGNCILRRKPVESEISIDETISIHSGTDSQYERANPDVSPEKTEESDIPEKRLIKNTSNDSLYVNYSRERSPETNRDNLPKRRYTYPEEYPEDTHKKSTITQRVT